MSKDRESRVLWQLGDIVATGFLSPQADLLYLGRKDNPFGGVILTVEDLARISVGHQTRKRRAVRDEAHA